MCIRPFAHSWSVVGLWLANSPLTAVQLDLWLVAEIPVSELKTAFEQEALFTEVLEAIDGHLHVPTGYQVQYSSAKTALMTRFL